MQRIQNTNYFLTLITILLLFACNGSSTTSEETATDSTSPVSIGDTSSTPAYDPAMEPLTVGEQFSKKLGDTLNIKFYEFTLKPGDSANMHTHPDHAVYVLEGGKLAVTFQGIGRQIMDLKKGMGFISGALSDAGKNIGNTTIKILVADIYRPRGGGAASMPGYDPALDPLTAGGAFSKKLHDTLNVKIFEFALKPGASAPLHAHPDHAIYILQGGKLMVYPQGDSATTFEMETNTGWIGGPLTDSAKNIGKTTIKAVEIDVYRPSGK